MTPAPRSPLVEKVAKAIFRRRWDQKTDEPWECLRPSGQHAYLDQAQAALEACHMEEIREKLNQIAAWSEGQVVNPGFDEPCAARIARALLAKLGERS